MSNLSKIVSVIAILKFRNKFLLVQRSTSDSIFPGLWQNVGGKVEKIEDALFREVHEELGLILPSQTRLHFVMSYSWVKDISEPVRMGIVFLVKLKTKPMTIELCDELDLNSLNPNSLKY